MEKKETSPSTNETATELPLLTAAAILDAKDIVVKRVEVPEWGGVVYVRSMSGANRERYIESIRRIRGRGKKQDVEILLVESSAKLAAMTMCNEQGVLLFPDASTGIITQLAEKSAKALQRVVDAAADLNGLSDDSEEDAGEDSARTQN